MRGFNCVGIGGGLVVLAAGEKEVLLDGNHGIRGPSGVFFRDSQVGAV